MERSGRTGAWVLLLGIVLGALLAPQVAEAVGSIVTIQGGGGTTKASVTDGKQLQVAEAPPSSFREFATAATGPSCTHLASIPGTKGFVVRSMSIEVLTAASTGFPIAQVFPNGTCAEPAIVTVSTRNGGTRPVQVEPGFAMAAGKSLSMKVGTTDALVAVHVFGYLVPSADVPSTTPIGS
jgi:hypothetical protein